MILRQLAMAVGFLLGRDVGNFTPLSEWPNLVAGGWDSNAVTRRMLAGGAGPAPMESLGHAAALIEEPIIREQLDVLLKVPLRSAKLLDYGCGNGVYKAALAAFQHTATWSYHGVDVNSNVIRAAQKTFGEQYFSHVSYDSPLSIGESEYDVVLASGVLQCVRNPLENLQLLRRVSKNWILVGRIPVRKFHPDGIYLQHVGHAWGIESHPVHIFNIKTVREMFELAGLTVEHSEHGVESYRISGESEPVHHMLFLLRAHPNVHC